MDNVFDTPEAPDPPDPVAELPDTDPEEAARRRASKQKKMVTRDSLVIDQGVVGKGPTGTGLRIG